MGTYSAHQIKAIECTFVDDDYDYINRKENNPPMQEKAAQSALI